VACRPDSDSEPARAVPHSAHSSHQHQTAGNRRETAKVEGLEDAQTSGAQAETLWGGTEAGVAEDLGEAGGEGYLAVGFLDRECA